MRLKIILPIIALAFFSCGGESHDTEEDENNSDSTSTTSINTTEEPEVVNSYLIKPYQVGIFTVGEVVPQLPGELKSRSGAVGGDEGAEIELNIIFNNLEDLVDLYLEDNPSLHFEDKAVTEMLVHSNYYETEKGIHVGSTIHDFAVTYPDHQIWYSYISDRYVMDSPELENVQFILDGDDYLKEPKGDSDMEILDQADFNVDAEIKAIRVY